MSKDTNGKILGFIETKVNLSLNEEFFNCEVEQSKTFSAF